MIPPGKKIERAVRENLEKKIHVCVSKRTARAEDLAEPDRERLSRFKSRSRKEDWLKGRAALKMIFARLPNPRFSLSHAKNHAVAAGIEPEVAAGIGIDLEFDRKIKKGSERFFLAQSERKFIETLPAKSRQKNLLRLWTVKEAVYKACPKNKNTSLPDFVLSDPKNIKGEARLSSGRKRFEYYSLRFAGGFISVALLFARGGVVHP